MQARSGFGASLATGSWEKEVQPFGDPED